MAEIAQQVTDFLSVSAPFDTLSENEIAALIKGAELLYLNEECVAELTHNVTGLYLIQNGQYSVVDSNEPARHLSDGDFFGYPAFLDSTEYPINIKVDRPGLVYRFARDAFTAALDKESVRHFFAALQSNSLQHQMLEDSNSMWLYKPLRDVVSKAPVSISKETTIRDAAVKMTEYRVSSLLITEQEELVGIVTDRDLRSRVVAEAMPYSHAVSTVMTSSPSSISEKKTMFDAMALMTEKNIHHLPVVKANSQLPVGMVTASDIVRLQRSNVLFIIGELAKAESLYTLARLSWQLPHYFSAHAKRVGDFDIAGKILSQATDTMTRKLIGFFQEANGKAPMLFAWLVYGSQAREDQTMGSDQDNALLLASEPTPEQADYFKAMSEYVCNGLAKCGIKLCDGNIMASNPELRLSINSAVHEAARWVKEPTSDAIMHFNIFLDARCAAGDTSLFKQLQEKRAPLLKQSMFLAALARHTNSIAVPLSVFQKFVFEKGAAQKDAIDIKVRAVALVNNIARVYALASGISEPSTLARLKAIDPSSGLSKKDAKNLADIWVFLNRLRWRHQLSQNVTDNLVSISELSSIEKHQLKAAFKAIDRAKQAMVMRFSGGMG